MRPSLVSPRLALGLSSLGPTLIFHRSILSAGRNAVVQIVTWDIDQWVSWDDAVTLQMKMDFANRRCLGGTLVWAIDLDDGTLISALGSGLSRSKSTVYDVDDSASSLSVMVAPSAMIWEISAAESTPGVPVQAPPLAPSVNSHPAAMHDGFFMVKLRP